MKIRGQVTIFIILAILIVGIGVLIYVFKDDIGIGKGTDEANLINSQVISCLEDTTNKGINYIALHGGYYEIPDEILREYYIDKFPYYYINSRTYIPSLEKINNELENYISKNFKDCLNFSSFEEQGFKIGKGELVVSSSILEEKVIVEIKYPLVITKGDYSSKLSKFETEIPSNILKLRDASEEITKSYSLQTGFVCLTCLNSVSNKYNVDVKSVSLFDTINPEKDVFFFSVLDKESELNWKFVVQQ